MKIRYVLCIVIVFAVFIGCSSTRPPSTLAGKIMFDLDGNNYSIESMTPPDQIGYNMLIAREDGKINLNAVDKDQDGIIDKLITGDMSVEEAQRIYNEGIVSGKKRGVVRQKILSRVFRMSDNMNHYALHTYDLQVGGVYNKLYISSRRNSLSKMIATDLTADGELNVLDKNGKIKLSDYQKLYDSVLSRGVSKGKIINESNTYLVAVR